MSDYISQTITVSSCQSDISNQCRIKTPCITGMAEKSNPPLGGLGGGGAWPAPDPQPPRLTRRTASRTIIGLCPHWDWGAGKGFGTWLGGMRPGCRPPDFVGTCFTWIPCNPCSGTTLEVFLSGMGPGQKQQQIGGTQGPGKQWGNAKKEAWGTVSDHA